MLRRCLGAKDVLWNVLPRGNAGKLHVPARAPPAQPLKLAFASRQRRARRGPRCRMMPQQMQETSTRGCNSLSEILLLDAGMQRGLVREGPRCGQGEAFRTCSRGAGPRCAVCCGAARPPRLHLLQQRLECTAARLAGMHMPHIGRGHAGLPRLQGTKGTQGSPLGCSASRGCPGTCGACSSTSTERPQLCCDSMHRGFQHRVFLLQAWGHGNGHCLLLRM